MNAYPYEDEEVDDDALANEEYEADAFPQQQRHHQSDQDLDLLEPSTDNFKVKQTPPHLSIRSPSPLTCHDLPSFLPSFLPSSCC
jgi:hypothetical protein